MNIEQQIIDAELKAWKLLNDNSKPVGTKEKIMSNAMYSLIITKNSKYGFRLTIKKTWGKQKQHYTDSTMYHFRDSLSMLVQKLTGVSA